LASNLHAVLSRAQRSRSEPATEEPMHRTIHEHASMPMTPGLDGAGSFVVVNLDREGDEIAQIAKVFEPLGIPLDVVGRGRQMRRAPTIVFRIPPHRVAEVIVALELQGFSDVLAYELDGSESP
jgi:hypothetical protein